ncbi:MAG: 30S ribosomal protein S12 methylthiotransferase RimO [Defluviitaleaceae bacterium]|nr:30S ribosomal protein S12 methylthiotransferase RimO [Defluviitaleaceae bacterium]
MTRNIDITQEKGNVCEDAGISFCVYLITLGCDKNRVDSEVMLARLLETRRFTPVTDPQKADAIIVNTCGFIREATQESIDTILEMASYKADASSPCRALIVTGCMSERYREDAKTAIPEADAILGVKDTETIVQVVLKLMGEQCPAVPMIKSDPGLIRSLSRSYFQAGHVAHVKISDGCDNACTYCTIPAIRGAYTSRPIQDILAECMVLIESGARELVLVAQDTALYGVDLYGKPRLHELIRAIANLPGSPWIRLMYAYPEHITPNIITAMAELTNVCKYIDMPIQHSETAVLKRMGRPSTREGLLTLIHNLREKIPGIALRTTIMVGFPGETVENFRSLYDFVKEARFDRLGVFPYSREEGTPAAIMPQQVKEDVKHTRRDRLMRLQQKIHQEKQQAKIGHTIQVIVDEALESNIYVGRTQHDAYEVDAVVRFVASTRLNPGDIVHVTITGADDYDLQGVLGNESSK